VTRYSDNQPADLVRPYVPTHLSADGTRHIILGKGEAPLCEAAADGRDVQPYPHWPNDLCPRCMQRHARRLLGITPGWGWKP
jgi:hypothetical protein